MCRWELPYRSTHRMHAVSVRSSSACKQPRTLSNECFGRLDRHTRRAALSVALSAINKHHYSGPTAVAVTKACWSAVSNQEAIPWMAPGSPPPAPASRSGAVQRAETALRGFTARQASRSPGLPQQPTITVAQRSGALQTAPPSGVGLRAQDGLLPRTRAQLPLWYITLRQVVLDAYRAVAVVYRVANHVLGSLFEVGLPLCLPATHT